MKLMKYEHACFTVEKDHRLLVVDPGSYSGDFIAPEHVAVIVITHQHQDHFDPDVLVAIYNKNPESLLLADQSIIDLMPDHRGQAVRAGERISVEGFDLEFFGGSHALIHESIPASSNIGVMINDLLYYPGDSLTIPDKPVDTLAVPAAAPWLRIGEAIDFLLAIKPRLAFPTHDAILSEIGQDLSDTLLGKTAQSAGIEYRRLTEALEI